MPGIAASTKLTLELAGRPNSVELPEKSLLSEVTCAWTSSPITISQSPVWPLTKFLGFGARVSTMDKWSSVLLDVVNRASPGMEALFEPDAHLRFPSGISLGFQCEDLVALMLV